MSRNGNQTQPGRRAVIIGSGIAGLAAARVLAKHDHQVTIIDRDLIPREMDFRPGIPQAYHAHTLLPFGLAVLEKLFPGMVAGLIDAGAQMIDEEHDTAYYDGQALRAAAPKASRPIVATSRPLLEGSLYRAVAAMPHIQILEGVDALGIVTDEPGSKVAGLAIRSRQAQGAVPKVLPADLVIDASGRNSKTPKWLEDLGFPAPEEWRINAHGGYASRLYRQPEGSPAWKKLYISPNPPDSTRGGIILPLEGGRWHVTLFGLSGDYPPADEEGFLQFARSLPSPALYDAIRDAEPLNKIVAFRKIENRVRRYEILPSYLEGLLVLGDAAYTMNPVYALGMTAALVSGQVLDEVLEKQPAKAGPVGLAGAFQKRLAARMANLWRQAVNSDWRWPATDISDNTEELYPEVVL